jgi:hypothetical protein
LVAIIRSLMQQISLELLPTKELECSLNFFQQVKPL